MSEIDDLMQAGKQAQAEGRLVDAHNIFDEAGRNAKFAGDGMRQAEAMIHIGAVARERGKIDQALYMYGEAVGLLRKVNMPLKTAAAWRTIAEIHEARHDLPSAQRPWREARDIYTKEGMQAEADACATHLFG